MILSKINENGSDLEVYDIKLYYYKEFNEFSLLKELKNEENELLKNLSQTNYDVLNILFKHLGNEKQLYKALEKQYHRFLLGYYG